MGRSGAENTGARFFPALSTIRQYVGPSFVYRVELDSGEAVHCLHNHVEEFDLDEPVSLELTADHPLAWYPR